ncbi:MAG: cytochrome c biogenesis protein CcsA [Bacteroidota bacterium]
MNTIRKVIRLFFSMTFMGIAVIVLALAMAAATFIENRNGTIAAKALVYQSWWFVLAIGLVFINILANIVRAKLYNLKRLPVFVFHLAFLVIIIGAALTRFVGKEGILHIREGETTSSYISGDSYFYVKAESRFGQAERYQKVWLSPVSRKQVNLSFRLGNDHIRINSIEYITGDQMKMGSRMNGMTGNPDYPDIVQLKITVNGSDEKVLVKGKQKEGFIPNESAISGIRFVFSFGSRQMALPFALILNDFQLDRYPGSNSPSSFASEVTLTDTDKQVTKPCRIFMNNILKYRGYRFYQSSYDPDEKGTILSVNHDDLGTTVTYTGYFLMFAFIILAFFTPGSRFRRLLKESRKAPVVAGIALFLFLLPGFRLPAQISPGKPDAAEAREFGKLWVSGNEGRIKPVSTLSQEMIRKVFGENRFAGMAPEQLWLSMLMEPEKWADMRIIEVKNSDFINRLGIQGKKASYNDFFKHDRYLLGDPVNKAYLKKPNQRNGFDKAVIRLDEILNIVFMSFTGQLMQIYPDPGDSKARWLLPGQARSGLMQQDSLMIRVSLANYLESLLSGDLNQASVIRAGIADYQNKYAADLLPSVTKANLEVLYNKALIFERLTVFYALVGFLFLLIQIWSLFKPARWQKTSNLVFGSLLFAGWILHTAGLGLRWYLSGHAPMSNGYESMVFVAWGTLLAGFLAAKRSRLPLALTGVLAALVLLVAHMSWMNPQITPLVPVLKSVWLTIHVAVIMTSYSFLGLGALIGLITMFLYIAKTKSNLDQINGHIRQLTRLNQIVLIIGLYLITIGCFLGAIWANQAWGRYWGWDPKETWCLITILLYSFVLHMHHIKGFEKELAFNFGSVMGFGSVLMTYFGVNYFLGGMHSYAGGGTPSVPIGLYIALIAVVVLVYAAWFSEMRFQPKKNK